MDERSNLFFLVLEWVHDIECFIAVGLFVHVSKCVLIFLRRGVGLAEIFWGRGVFRRQQQNATKPGRAVV